MLLMRLAVSVAYNFLELSNISNCAFFQVMGPLSNVDFLGSGFNRWVFPTALLLMVLLTIFKIYERVLNCFGLKQYAFDEVYAEEKVVEGQFVIN